MQRFSVIRLADTLRTIGPRQFSNMLLNRLESLNQIARVRSYPQVVDLVLTKACNLKCKFCKDYDTPDAKKLSLQRFDATARLLFPKARQLSLCSGGEPYLHKGLLDILRVAKHYHVPTWLLSNGTRATEEQLRTIVNEQLVTWHGFSVDGIEASTVESIRVKADFSLIMQNIRRLLQIRAAKETRFPRVVIRYALMRSNIEELPRAVRFWGSLGADHIDCSFLSICNGIDPHESLHFHKQLTRRAFLQAERAASDFPSLSLSLPHADLDRSQSGNHSRRCRQPWELIYLDPDGMALPCYHSWRMMQMGNVADLDEASFQDLWNGTKYRRLRQTVNSNHMLKAYHHCENCPERLGMGEQEAHFEDEQWMEPSAISAKKKAAILRYRRR